MKGLYIFFILIVLTIVGCCPRVVGITTTTSTQTTQTATTRERTIDTIVQADTVYQTIKADCDSLGVATFSTIDSKNGKRTSLSTISIGNNKLRINCVADSLRVVLIAKDSLIHTLQHTLEQKEITINKPEPWYNIFTKSIGGFIVLACFILFGLNKITK